MPKSSNPSAFEGVAPNGDVLGFTNLHDANLFDEDSNRAGEHIDPATGKPYDNSTELYDLAENDSRHRLTDDELEQIGMHIVDLTGDDLDDDPYAREAQDLIDAWEREQQKKRLRTLGNRAATAEAS